MEVAKTYCKAFGVEITLEMKIGNGRGGVSRNWV